MMKKILILGCGFNGFCSALELLKKKKVNITMLDQSKNFGGIMYSNSFKNFYIDNGVHVFDSIPKELAKQIKKIMRNKIKSINFISKSAFNKKVTDGFSLPDLSSISLSKKKKITYDLLKLEKKYNCHQPKFSNLHEFFKKRFGSTATLIFTKIFNKLYNIHPKNIEPEGITRTSLARLKYLDDHRMIKLKKNNKYLDSVLAARRKKMGKIDDFVSIYPSNKKAMRGWCINSKNYLEKRGVNILLNSNYKNIYEKKNKVYVKINNVKKTFDKIIWCNNNLKSISDLLSEKYKNYTHPIPVVFYIFVTKANNIKNFTYLQNFDLASLSYRISASGCYSDQIDKNGNSFLTIECPTNLNSKIWINPKKFSTKIWNECKRLKLIKNNSRLIDLGYKCIPKTVEMPKKGYLKYRNSLYKRANKKFKNIIFDSSSSFFRRDIYFNSKKIIQKI